MGLREIRKKCGITQKELAEISGVNFRSLQDYEQGHKKLTSANGDVLLRLSTVLSCTTEELLIGDDFRGAELLHNNRIDVKAIRDQRFFSEKYRTAGRWICNDKYIAVLFYYKGKQYTIPFKAIFNDAMMPWLPDAAVLLMESKIADIDFIEAAVLSR